MSYIKHRSAASKNNLMVHHKNTTLINTILLCPFTFFRRLNHYPLFILLFTCLGIATKPLLAQTLSFDSRYVIHGYSNQAVGQFGVELINLVTVPANVIVSPASDTNAAGSNKKFLFYNSSQLRNVANGLLLFIGSAFLSSSFTFAYHEYGHGTRAAAVGFKPFYGHGSINTEADINAVLSGSIKTYDNFLSFYRASLFNTGGFTFAIPEKTLFTPLTDELNNNGWDGLLLTGGLNNEMLFTEFIEDELYGNSGHIGFMLPYLSGKLSAQSYGTGTGVFNDLTNIVNFYDRRGYNIDSDMITNASVVSFWGSAMSYQLIYQFFRTLAGKSSRFTPWQYRGFQLPNTSFYMNRAGLSYKIRSGYRWQEWRFPFALEHVFEGEKRTELSFGAEKSFGKTTPMIEATIGKRLELTLDMSYRQNRWLMFTGGYALYDQRNLHGERFIPSLENGPTYHEFYLKTSVIY